MAAANTSCSVFIPARPRRRSGTNRIDAQPDVAATGRSTFPLWFLLPLTAGQYLPLATGVSRCCA